MQFRLEKRAEISRSMLYFTPVAAVLLTMIMGAIIFTILGFNGAVAVREIFLTPLTNSLKWQDLAVKSAPLIIIAIGLSIGFRANVWNIGAEGQYIAGGLAATGVALITHQMSGWWLLPLMGVAGILGGMACFFKGQVKRQRNSDHPDADLCGRAIAELFGVWPVEKPNKFWSAANGVV